MKKEFTLLQLFSILDGRLSTEIGDVYEMLNHITNDDLMTHHLPTAMRFIKEKNPVWFSDLKNELVRLGISKELPFNECLEILKSNNTTHFIPQIPAEQKKEFEKYMIDNSLLLRK